MATEGRTFKVLSKGKISLIGDFQLKIIGEISVERLSKSEAERRKGGQWLCNCTSLFAGYLTTRYSHQIFYFTLFIMHDNGLITVFNFILELSFFQQVHLTPGRGSLIP